VGDGARKKPAGIPLVRPLRPERYGPEVPAAEPVGGSHPLAGELFMKQCGKGKNGCSLSFERYWMPNKRLCVKKGGDKKMKLN
jgi:hypothetical protein